MKGHALPGPNQRPQEGDSPLEKFDWSSAIGGAFKGAKVGMKAGPWGAVAGALGGGALAGFTGGKKEEESQEGVDEEGHLAEHERLKKESL